MVNNNQWPFENAGREFYVAMPQELVDPMEDMLHHVQPGLSITGNMLHPLPQLRLKKLFQSWYFNIGIDFIGTSMDLLTI
jgi:hypothetical protein